MTWQDLWGWGKYSWLLLIIGLWAVRRQWRVWLIASVFPSLVVVYLAYWVSGPRYFYEGLYSLTILGAAGIAWLGGWLPWQQARSQKQANIQRGAVLIALVLLLLIGTFSYTPDRLHEIKDQYGFSQTALVPFQTPEAQDMIPALVIIHTSAWADYGVFLHLQDPYLSSPFIFAWAAPRDDPSAELAQHFPNRTIYHYYPDQPGNFYPRQIP
jgi:hypothetical protein